MKRTTYISSILMLTLFLTSFSITSWAQNESLKNNDIFSKKEKKRLKGVPTEFGKDRDAIMICILQDRNSFDKYLKKNMRENYNGRKIFITRDKLDLELYSDLKKYPFIFDVNQESKSYKTFNNNIAGDNKWQTNTTRSYNFSILDRAEGKLYEYPSSSSAFGKLIKSYAILLNKVRKVRLAK